jgi:hypothetical protein
VIIGMATVPPSHQSQSGPSGGHLSVAECSQIESNSNLSATVSYLYYGNGNRTGSGSGLIDQSPPGPSAYPSESTAVTNVVSGWGTVCTSNAFFVLEQRWGSQNASSSGLDRNSTGIYEDQFTIDWVASASQCAPLFGDCLGSAEWLVNVASGGVSGPNTTFVSPQPAE